jgi:hypothetical protein
MRFALIVAFAVAASPAMAKVKHHCVGADGSEIYDAATKKKCKKAHGKWKRVKNSDVAK